MGKTLVNEHTDNRPLKTGLVTPEYEEGFDRIFPSKAKANKSSDSSDNAKAPLGEGTKRLVESGGDCG